MIFQQAINPILRTYSMLLFSQRRLLGLLLLEASFISPVPGLMGLAAVLLTLLLASLTGMSAELRLNGTYIFNSLLFAIGYASVFTLNKTGVFVFGCGLLMTLALSVLLNARLGKNGLPFLTLPFILVLWIIFLSAGQLQQLGLSFRLPGELFSLTDEGQALHAVETINWPPFWQDYFTALSGVLFQHNVLCGILVAIGLILVSRIAFLLSLVGFSVAWSFGYLTGGFGGSQEVYYLGVNYVLMAIAVGSFFSIPSVYSFGWSIILLPLLAFLMSALAKLTGIFGLPLFSFPFSVLVILFISFMRQRTTPRLLQLTGLQHYSPEANLYYSQSIAGKVKDLQYFRLHVPFLGEWAVTQGYKGSHTHKGDWSEALDFMILDDQMKTFSGDGLRAEDYYCFGKPVLAPAEGTVEELVDGIEDNAPGQMDTFNNWGNTIIIRHAAGFYTKLSHLKKGSFRVRKGDFVRRGDMLALCGNSGRSPYPHLHFQAQSTAFIGARTLAYPMAYYLLRDGRKKSLQSFTVPAEGQLISAPEYSGVLSAAYRFQPGFTTRYRYSDGAETKEETWEVHVTPANLHYLLCRETGATAYFVNDGTSFFFTGYYGSRASLLHLFFKASYRVMLSNMPDIVVEDELPLHLLRNSPMRMLQDFAAPFFRFLRWKYALRYLSSGDQLGTETITLSSRLSRTVFGNEKLESEAKLELSGVNGGRIEKMIFTQQDKTIEAVCVSEN